MVRSDLGVDAAEIVLNHLFGNAEVLGDFTILQSTRHHFDNTQLARARLWARRWCYEQMPTLGFQFLRI